MAIYKVDKIDASLKAISSVVVVSDSTPATYPKYVEVEKQAVATRLAAKIASVSNPIVIVFNTDQHLIANPSSEGSIKTRDGIAYGIRTIRDLSKIFFFNVVILGGDTHGSPSGTIESMQASSEYVRDQIKGVNAPYIMLVGNHEGGQDNENITRDQVYASHVTKSQVDNVIIPIDRTTGYYDIPEANVRIIFLDAFPRSQVITYSTSTINTILNGLLNAIPNGYKAIIFSHHPLDETLPQNSARTLWNNPTACHATLQNHKDKIIACFCGHIHNNLYIEDHDGITFIGTTCSGKYELNDGSTRTTGTATETAYDIFVIDQENEVINAIRYGNGNDRTISYAHETPPPEPRGNIIDETTWQDGVRLNSSGALVEQSGYSTCGIIENVKDNDILYFADGVLPVSTTAMNLYDDDGNLIGQTTPISVSDYGATYDNSKMYVETLTSSDGKKASYYWRGILAAKNPESTEHANGYIFTEFEFWESGYIKSCKVGDGGVHWAGVAKIRFTFPTAKKADVDIRVNEPFE